MVLGVVCLSYLDLAAAGLPCGARISLPRSLSLLAERRAATDADPVKGDRGRRAEKPSLGGTTCTRTTQSNSQEYDLSEDPALFMAPNPP